MMLNPKANLLIPDQQTAPVAFSRTTHLGIGAHQDDLEFMAYEGVLACYDRTDQWFGGVIMTDGRSSSRKGPYADWTDDQMAAERIKEQHHAAVIGQYSFIAQLGYLSKEVRPANEPSVVGDLLAILMAAQPEVVYLHNPADKHDTHVACLLRCIEALRAMPAELRPQKVLGCEVWRGLDWMLDAEKVSMAVSAHPELANALNAVFATQIVGGKRYDLAVLGRRIANATFHDAHASDQETSLQWALDLTPLINDPQLEVIEYTLGFVDRLKQDIADRLKRAL
ncbi:MAG: PIG-L family deacetylase [Verrucomicrobia bacterium]|nr:PIG-L family deacetylase [Verrucomicrobiota bacterium]